MKLFAVYESRVSGSLPVTLFPPTMQMLYLSNSLISGTVPKNMSAATSLIKLMAGKLALSGTLPDAFTNLIKFSVLCVNDDHLSGIVPPTLGRVGSRATTYMKRMLLDNNRFSGSSPVNISFDRLQFFGISFNRALDWDLNLLSNPLSTLKYAMLQGCGIRGTLPVELPPDMEILLLHDNLISATIHQNTFLNFKNLTTITISQNDISGILPPSFGLMESMSSFLANDMRLSGTIPRRLSRASSPLTVLAMARNYIVGDIDALAGTDNL